MIPQSSGSFNDEAAYREEVQNLIMWCANNTLVLSTKKTKEIIVDFRTSIKITHIPPSVSLLQRSPSSPVTCHATGFYPDRIVMFWKREEEELQEEEVDHGELLPNHDGTFQRSVHLLVDLSSMKAEDWQKYHCVVQLSGMKDDIITKLDQSQIKTNRKDPVNTIPIIIGVLAAVIFIIIAVLGAILYQKKKAKCPPPSPDSSSELSQKLNPGASH
ncbi:BOLA class I histocompatibility antigen, alpha chain BL3-7-like [Lampris incognitus]|uniref:BOLA class I histocompatibility antigen, alpha chain BL3-7-like n=1 Tax=Lampris incognitus TaxID=2546036 RepID=UPI0024B5E032|nr:BOLA class I histocompatibility antigen, alpha chain BL3-7-like [Lampris incognitus]